jgi:hypothetical protein
VTEAKKKEEGQRMEGIQEPKRGCHVRECCNSDCYFFLNYDLPASGFGVCRLKEITVTHDGDCAAQIPIEDMLASLDDVEHFLNEVCKGKSFPFEGAVRDFLKEARKA